MNKSRKIETRPASYTKKNNKTFKNKKNNKNNKKDLQTLRNTYGYMTIPKGLTFYHARDTPYDINNPDNVLFLTFQQSDWANVFDKYITKFVVKKSFDILFMVDKLYNGQIDSLLPRLTKKPVVSRLNKQHDKNLRCYFPYMLKENLIGWFCSIEDRTGIEIAIHDSNKYLEKIETVKIKENNNNNNNNINGYNRSVNNIENEYIINTEKFPVKLFINEIYKNDINKFKDKSIKNNYNYPSQVLFKNAIITYFKNKYDTDMFWPC